MATLFMRKVDLFEQKINEYGRKEGEYTHSC
jgi:hypothetical protein